MHPIHLTDLASILAIHGPALLFRRDLVPEEALQMYWVACRARADAWHERLGAYRRLEEMQDRRSMRAWWRENEVLVDEVLLAESLTRVMAGFGAMLDEGVLGQEVSPITHAVYTSQLEVRNRVLRIMVADHARTFESLVRLNKLRYLAERCCDALLGQLWATGGVVVLPYSFDQRRMRAYGEEAAGLRPGTTRDTAGWLLVAAMRDSLMRTAEGVGHTEQRTRAVAEAVLLCLRPDLFDAFGQLESLWLHRLERGSEQTDQVLRQLAEPDITTAAMLGAYEAIHTVGFGRW